MPVHLASFLPTAGINFDATFYKTGFKNDPPSQANIN